MENIDDPVAQQIRVDVDGSVQEAVSEDVTAAAEAVPEDATTTAEAAPEDVTTAAEAIPVDDTTTTDAVPEDDTTDAEAVSRLEGMLISNLDRPAYEAFFKRARALLENVRASESTGPYEKAALEQHVHEITRAARAAYDRRRVDASTQLHTVSERLSLARELLADAQSVQEVEEVRADIRLAREQLAMANAWAPREVGHRVWEQWQTTNSAAWTALNAIWATNDQSLEVLLESAASELRRGNPRIAKDKIKEFHDRTKAGEASRSAVKTLRERAHVLWDEATTASREKHEAYVHVARKRLEFMRVLSRRNDDERKRVESDIRQLQAGLGDAQTDVAAALLRGQLGERQKQLKRLEAEAADIADRIRRTESVVS